MNINDNKSAQKIATEIRAVFFDVDGTLVSFKTNSVPASARKAIDALRQKGIKVIVATGRSIKALEVLNEISFDGFICFNGGLCATVGGEILHKQMIHADDIRALVQYQKEKGVNYALMYHDRVFIQSITQSVEDMYKHVDLPVPPVLDPENIDFENVLQANIFITPEEEKKFMETVMFNSVATRWTPLFADVNSGGLNKYIGVEIFCRHFGIDPSQTMSFGDGGNDIAMLTQTAIGVAMGNANPPVKEIADYVTADVDSNGIWKALEHFGLVQGVIPAISSSAS
ncbi:Cof-type HAD-IIB family hydrolase [Terrimonas sp. NA20]|uniref:Cof-type HAD-IIB family hydrolase n=1 Tax=Terrimonas ginsenosidimutans TaxID=2908004 RepID=A0ABS9KYU8_9BACT|nr:Cof-type HAD-IIB family hydrolase [Terrimonas ginsenosidimutans]MCG2617490.1 Cof-type HAD-IIB family hydrolase [Terrimonas ginsenosidimutans]